MYSFHGLKHKVEFVNKKINVKSSGEWNLIRQAVFNADNNSLESPEAIRSK